MERKSIYETALNSRYASKAMQSLFSPDYRYGLWRRLWVALAEAEMELGLPIAQDQIDQMKRHLDDIDYERVRAHEEKVRHDVMAHVLAYGEQCPDAAGIIHLGATSCYVTDNADALILRDALELIRAKIIEVVRRLRVFALEHRDLPTLGLTHLQPAQLVTVGKRACLWMQDLVMDLTDIEHVLSTVKLLGSKGTTGTQASFLELFGGDDARCLECERRIAGKMGLDKVYAVSGQTYPRKLDSRVLAVLSGVAQSAYKFAQDMRMLQAFHELEEPFSKDQIGSSAMAYKRNPMRSERMCALSRHVMALEANATQTAATQWFERTLDDSANRRLSLPEAFLALDAVLELYANVAGGIVVYPKMIERSIRENLPFMATENILMAGVMRGGDRQQLHEKLRVLSHQATVRMRAEGEDNDLLRRIAADGAFGLSEDELGALMDARLYVGRAGEQVSEFIAAEVDPRLVGPAIDMGEINL
ncbi:MAG: adenylosuccinate lyase [Eubacteriales bacterium]|nr:adenylosuccinate lyase [Christensenellaceae bacterium]MEA5065080.1 adenylosuccinate lyase [Eubacteriales bacterium]